MKRNNLPILTLIAILVVASLACSLSIGLPAITIPPTDTPTPIPVSTQAAGEFVNSLKQPTLDAAAGTATIVLTEEEITSYVAEQLQADPNPFIRNPQVILENSQIVVTGTIVTDILTAPGSLTATVAIGEDGLPKTQIIDAKVGAFPIPTPLLSRVSQMIDQGIAQNIDQFPDNYRLEDISIANHQMIIVFKKK